MNLREEKPLIAFLKGEQTTITPELVHEHFVEINSMVFWKVSKLSAGNQERTRLVMFGRVPIHLTDIAFTLHHGRFPTGKIVLNDGDQWNMAKDNLIETEA